jgi:hypothetical protein
MTDKERKTIITALTSDYEASYGPQSEWSEHTKAVYHEELGIMVNCVGILREAGILPPIAKPCKP